MKFVGADATSHISGLTELPGKSNYLLSNDSGKWRKNVPHYAKVKYEKMYPGIDLVFYGNDQELEYDFVVAPGANPDAITLAFRGAKKIEIDPNGDVWIEIADKRLKLRKPKIYQDLSNQRRAIQGGYIRKGPRSIGFRVAKYDPQQTLVIDPVVVVSTFLGGSRLDRINAITVDRDGNIYVAGSTTSADFPTENALDGSFAGGNLENTDAFVAKLNSSGTELEYSTYLGGSRDEFGDGIAVDQDGNAYVTGATFSSDFPTTAAAYQLNRRGDEDVFVAKLDVSGSTFVYSTYLGGSCSNSASTTDHANGIALDGAANVYVTGTTECHDFPTTLGAAQASYGGGSSDAFITKINASGTALIYSSFIGGRSAEEGNGLALDQDANVYITGFTDSLDFPITAGAFQTTRPGQGDGFVTKLSADGSALVYSTYLGGSQAGGSDPAFDWCQAIAVDTSGNAYVTGHTSSLNFPVANAIQTKKRGTWDAFVTAINSTGTALIYSTYVGGSGGVGGNEEGLSIAVDSLGRAYVTGQTPSADFPVTANAIQPSNAGGSSDIFVTILRPDGSLFYSSYLGGNRGDAGTAITVDHSGNLYIGGWTESANLPMVNALEPIKAGGRDGIVVKLSLANEVFVDQQYVDFLDREPDPGGFSAWVDALEGGFPRSSLIEAFMGSDEFRFKGKFIAQSYLGILTRDADVGGFQGWLESLLEGISREQIVQGFLGSGEFQANFGSNLTNGQFVETMYNNVLLRPSDSGGFSFWVGQLDSGQMTRAQVALGFLDSAEFQNLSVSQNRVDISLLYFDMLRRDPDAVGFSGWVGALNAGAPLTSVIDGFLNSAEYQFRL